MSEDDRRRRAARRSDGDPRDAQPPSFAPSAPPPRPDTRGARPVGPSPDPATRVMPVRGGGRPRPAAAERV
ncbi:hypothetical protein ACFO3F_12540, partial [Georgenia faecalis]